MFSLRPAHARSRGTTPFAPAPVLPGSGNGRIAWADTARGLAILLVVLYHATNWTAGTGYGVDVLREINEPLRSLRMPLFFTVAGMFAHRWVAAPWPTLLRGKLFHFAWVFVLWEPVTLTVRLLTGYYQVRDADWGSLADDLTWSLLLPRSELWFIWTLAALFVAARLLRRLPAWLQLAAATLVGAWALAGWEPESLAYRGLGQFCLFFLAGLHLRPLVERYAERLRWWSGLCVIAVWYGLTWVTDVFDLELMPGVYLVANVAGAFAGIAVSRGLAVVVPRLGWIGARTLPVYVLHTPLIHAILWIGWSNAIWVPEPASQFLPVAMTAVIVTTALLLDAATRRIGAGWLWGPPRAWLVTPSRRGTSPAPPAGPR
ncbi:acyltransferase family protein [Myceligenerans crystallogenes]|uniref:Acyltransferase n=1 Tax=Myceligenerans crystallogenes TaxID=316335 RepID=A0ABP4ZK88_9MICO